MYAPLKCLSFHVPFQYPLYSLIPYHSPKTWPIIISQPPFFFYSSIPNFPFAPYEQPVSSGITEARSHDVSAADDP